MYFNVLNENINNNIVVIIINSNKNNQKDFENIFVSSLIKFFDNNGIIKNANIIVLFITELAIKLYFTASQKNIIEHIT